MPELNLVEVNAEIDNDSVVPYVLKDLPKDSDSLTKLIHKYVKKQEQKAQITNLVLQRLRDYHDPLASGVEEQAKINEWNKFVIAMLGVWTTQDEDHLSVVKDHLQEILRQADQGAHVIIKYV